MAIKVTGQREIRDQAKTVEPKQKAVRQIKAEMESIPTNPKNSKKKKPISIRLSQEVVDYFEATGMGWQTRIDYVLLDYIAHNEWSKK